MDGSRGMGVGIKGEILGSIREEISRQMGYGWEAMYALKFNRREVFISTQFVTRHYRKDRGLPTVK